MEGAKIIGETEFGFGWWGYSKKELVYHSQLKKMSKVLYLVDIENDNSCSFMGDLSKDMK